MARRKRTTLQRAALFEKHGGICHLCEERIDGTREKWELEHVIAYELTQDDTDENLRPAHVKCHKAKTARDVAMLAKVKRVAAKHQGARPKSQWPGAGKIKRKVGGGVVFLDRPQDEEG